MLVYLAQLTNELLMLHSQWICMCMQPALLSQCLSENWIETTAHMLAVCANINIQGLAYPVLTTGFSLSVNFFGSKVSDRPHHISGKLVLFYVCISLLSRYCMRHACVTPCTNWILMCMILFDLTEITYYIYLTFV